MAGRLTARCRFCGTKVKFFGDLCADCDSPDLYDEDGLFVENELAKADAAALAAKTY